MFPVAPTPEAILHFLVGVCRGVLFSYRKQSAIGFCRGEKSVALQTH